MANIKQLAIVLSMANKKEQEALKVYSEAEQQLTQLKQQMESLTQYKADYLLQMKPENSQQVTAVKLIRLQGFLAKIDQSLSHTLLSFAFSITMSSHIIYTQHFSQIIIRLFCSKSHN